MRKNSSVEFFKRFSNLNDLYNHSLTKDFEGIGVVKKRYDIDSLDEDIKEVTDYFADDTFGEIREIKLNKNQSHSVAETTSEHALHTDATFSNDVLERFVLSFVEVEEDDKSGTSIFFPIEWILVEIPYKLGKALEVSTVSYVRKSEKEGDKKYEGPILKFDEDFKPIFRWRYDNKVKPKIIDSKELPINNAIEWVNEFIKNKEPLSYKAKAGETLIIDNTKILHGRTKLTEETKRIALRAWIK